MNWRNFDLKTIILGSVSKKSVSAADAVCSAPLIAHQEFKDHHEDRKVRLLGSEICLFIGEACSLGFTEIKTCWTVSKNHYLGCEVIFWKGLRLDAQVSDPRQRSGLRSLKSHKDSWQMSETVDSQSALIRSVVWKQMGLRQTGALVGRSVSSV